MMRKFTFVIILSLFFLLTASGNIDSIDATSHMYLAKQIVLKGRIDYGKDKLARKMVASYNKKDGNYYIVYNFGYALFFIPGVMLSEGIRYLFAAPSSAFPAQYDYIYTWYANLFNGAVITAICLLAYKILRRFNGNKGDNEFGLLLASVFGTNLVIQGHHQFAHPIFTLFSMLAFWKLWDYGEKGKRTDLVWFSFLLAVTASLYNTTFVLLFPAFAVFYYFLLQKNKNRIQALAIVLSTFIPAVMVQLFWNYLRYGNPLLSGYMELGFKVYELNPVENVKNLIGMTIGPNKGLLFNNPVLVVSYFVAVKETLKKESKFRSYSVFYLLLTAAYLLNYSFATIWHGESTYGPRYLFVLVPFGLPFMFLYWKQSNSLAKAIIPALIAIGVFIQIPGMLIPHFTFPHISKPYCIKPDYRYFDPRCSPPLVGWAQLMKRETKETPLVFKDGPLLTRKYPNPLTPFRTIYPDPLYDRFSAYKTKDYPVDEELINPLYAFTLDFWWLKQMYYVNITL